MARLKIDIVTPERRVAQAEADELVAPGAQGLFGVRPGHEAYLAALQAGPLTVREGSTSTTWFVSGGFVEAGPAAVRVLADSAELLEAIDVAAADKRITDAEAKLAQFAPADPRGDVWRDAIRVERKRIEVSKLK